MEGDPLMTGEWRFLLFALWVLLAAVLARGTWLSFRRTQAGGFLCLGAVLILWPLFEHLTQATVQYSVLLDEHMAGLQRLGPPFCLLSREQMEGMLLWEVPSHEFLALFNAAKDILQIALLAVAITLIARSLKKFQNKRESPDRGNPPSP
jgi:hypothetical protein